MSTEYRFYCPELNREVSTGECYDREAKRSCYGEVCEHVEKAICHIAYDRLKETFGDQISLELHETEGLLRIRFHENLTLEASYDRLFETIDFDAFLGYTHSHGFPAENVEGLICVVGELLRGEKAFVIKLGWFGAVMLHLVDQEELMRTWRKYTRGRRIRIVDGRGVYTKAEYEGRSNISAS